METQETGKEKRLTRKERVFHQLSELTCKVTLDDIRSVLGSGFEAGVIGGALGITPNNTCMELGALLKEERVVKIPGRPVYFFAREELEQSLGIRFSQCIFKNYGEFRDTVDRLLRSVSDGRTSPKLPPVSIDPTGSFSRLVGSRESLRPNIDQARAAILYPPSGLHCLITGQTGVGKSHFAEAMYDFAVEQGVIARDAAFVIYNCANYFENPQLLLSQLFGYKKGAFTGADRDTPGVVDQADGGILFLDEAHRLSPEGQEKMFLLIDKGIYQRLGETKEYHHARLRIIAATTEDPKSILLHTFLRRIPVLIQLPSLEERGVNERVSFIMNFLWQESGNVGCPLRVHREVIRALSMYKCPSNIGQLQCDVKLLCASAYLSRAMGIQDRDEEGITLELSHLPKRVEEGLFKTGVNADRIFSRYPFYSHEYVLVDQSRGDFTALLEECGIQ